MTALGVALLAVLDEHLPDRTPMPVTPRLREAIARDLIAAFEAQP